MNAITLVTSSPDKATVNNDDELLTEIEVAEMLKMSQAWVIDHCTRREPRLPFLNLGSGRYATRRFVRSHIKQFVCDQMDGVRRKAA